jgi:hypothetical protein
MPVSSQAKRPLEPVRGVEPDPPRSSYGQVLKSSAMVGGSTAVTQVINMGKPISSNCVAAGNPARVIRFIRKCPLTGKYSKARR